MTAAGESKDEALRILTEISQRTYITRTKTSTDVRGIKAN